MAFTPKTIIVTGANGFVGRALIEALEPRHHIVATDMQLAATPDHVTKVVGDVCNVEVRERLFAHGCDAVVHLATIAGGAAEVQPALAQAVNVDATMALIDAAARAGARPLFLFASSIAVLGEDLPPVVDDDTPLAPKMLYGGHKAMMEQWIATHSRRGAIEGLSLRLPGIVARPRGPSGMKSAFMSTLFHAIRAGEALTLPVSPAATMWLMSVDRIAANFIHALSVGRDALPPSRALTLPALRVSMDRLIAEVVRQCSGSIDAVDYDPDPQLERGFGSLPDLITPAADRLGFAHDGDIDALVRSALSRIDKEIKA